MTPPQRPDNKVFAVTSPRHRLLVTYQILNTINPGEDVVLCTSGCCCYISRPMSWRHNLARDEDADARACVSRTAAALWTWSPAKPARCRSVGLIPKAAVCIGNPAASPGSSYALIIGRLNALNDDKRA